MATTTTEARYKILGITDEVTTCERCGRDDLKRTVRLGVLDLDGNVEDAVHFGCDCAAKATQKRYCVRQTANRIERIAEEAQRATEEAKRNRMIEINPEEAAPGAVWVVESIGQNGGSTDRLCFAKGTRSAIISWAVTEFPLAVVNVRLAR